MPVLTSGHSVVLWLHVVASAALLGTSAAAVFFCVRARRNGDPTVIAAVARDVVAAEMLFALTAMILLPLTGVFLAIGAGYPLAAPWLSWSMGLYVLVGCCWLPTVWLQFRLRRLAAAAAASGAPLPDVFHQYYVWRILLGWPTLAGVLAIFYLMVAKPGV